jgi:hypothetical protein
MKRTIIFSFIVAIAAVFNSSSAQLTGHMSSAAGSEHVSTLVVNADINVVLINKENAALQVSGSDEFRKHLRIRKSGDSLIITSSGNRIMMGKGTVYVPATRLNHIRVNGDANIRSLYSLEVPRLDVLVNGECSIAISNIGELNVRETEAYSFEYTIDKRTLPAGVFRKAN